MEEYIYVFPYKIKKSQSCEEKEEIITQKSSFIIESNPLFDIAKEILIKSNNRRVNEVKEEFSEKLTKDKFDMILNFLVERDLVYISKKQLSKYDVNFMEFLAQYTISIEKYMEKMSKKTFCIYVGGDNVIELENKIKYFGLNYRLIDIDDIDLLNVDDIVLSSFDSSELSNLDKIAKKLEDKKDVLFAFTINFEDSFTVSPLLNKDNFTDYYSFINQIDISNYKDKGVSKNVLVQNMGINYLLLEVLTSIMKLKIQTSYDKAVTFNSTDKTITIDKIYYYPNSEIYRSKSHSLKRWDDESA